MAKARKARDAARAPESRTAANPAHRTGGRTGRRGDGRSTRLQLQRWQLAADAYGRYQQLNAGVEQAEAQVEQLDDQISAAYEQADKTAAQQAQQDEFTNEQETLTDEQKALTDEQTALGDEQTDLAEEQADIADIRAGPIQVSDVAEVRQELAPSAVTQIDGTRAVTLTATPESDNLGALTKTVQQKLDALDLPAGVDIETGGASEDQADAFRQLGLAMLLAIVIVFMIMVATFRSLIQPLVLLTSIPFAATGAVAGLLITDTPLGVPGDGRPVDVDRHRGDQRDRADRLDQQGTRPRRGSEGRGDPRRPAPVAADHHDRAARPSAR